MFDSKLKIVLLGLTCVFALIVSPIGAGLAQQSPNTQSNFRADFPLTKIEAKTYKNETVRIDGNEFIDCTFDNVVFQFDGEAPYRFTNAHFVPGSKVAIVSTNPAIRAAFGLENQVLTLQNPDRNQTK
jgi:hypothetical protein